MSGQENRCLASMSNDKGMIDAYNAGQDLYAVIGSMVFETEYENCLEFDPRNDYKLNPEGKARRSTAKMVNLALNYGMSSKSLADRVNVSIDRAEEIIRQFYKGFQGVDRFTKASQKMLRELGYVTDVCGRRRHIPDALLPEFEVTASNQSKTFNPLLGSPTHVDPRTEKQLADIRARLSKCTNNKQIDAVVRDAKKLGFSVKNNRGFISRAMRQCLNARIQGSSASITKLAMVNIYRDPELNRLGAKLLVTVHDEVFVECPTENSEAVAKRLCEVMVESASSVCGAVKWKCDPYNESAGWYESENIADIQFKYNKLLSKGLSEDEAIMSVQTSHPMFDATAVRKICLGEYVVGVDCIKHGKLTN